MTQGASFSPGLFATQSPGTDGDTSSASHDTGSSAERKFEELPMPELGRDEYVIDDVFYCPWSAWYPDDDKHCYHTFLSARDRHRHMRQHVKPVRCPCFGCQVRTAEQRDMKRHFEVHELSAARPRFQCPYLGSCESEFTREDNIPRHLKSVHGVEAQMYGFH